LTWRPLDPIARSSFGTVAFPQPTTLQRNVMLDLTAALGVGSSIAVVGALLPAVARRGGLDPMGLAALAALPFLASLLSLLAGRIGPRTPHQLALVRALGSAGLLIVLVAPEPLFIALAAFAFWAAMSLGGPTQQRLWTTMYPSTDRGRLLGIIGSGRSAAAMAALLAFTLVTTNDGWLPILAVVIAIGVGSAIATTRLRLTDGAVQTHYGAWHSIVAVWRRPMLRRITISQLVFGAGMVAAGAFIALVQVDRLDLSFGDVAMAGLMGALATTMTFGVWGRLASRTGPLTTMTSGTVLGATSLAVFALAQDATMILVASLLLGAHQAAIDASWPLLIADHAESHEQAAAAAGLGAIMGLRGLIIPFLFMVPLHAGLIDETGGLLLCTTVAAAGALMYVRLSGLGSRLTGRLRRPAEVTRPLSESVTSDASDPLDDRTDQPAEGHSSPASARTPSASSSGWPVIRRSRLMRSTIAGWVLKRPLALLSSFFTGLTT
jgi:MFS family permease